MKKIIKNAAGSFVLLTIVLSGNTQHASAAILAPTFSSNVVFIPGIEASRLYSKNILSYKDQLWEPNNNLDVEDLYLDTAGSSTKEVFTEDVIGKTNICGGCIFDQDIYQDFENSLDSLKAGGIINDWKAFPYDWRLDLNTTIDAGAQLSDGVFQKITDLLSAEAATSRTGKVSIVTHSNGGLVLKLLLVKLEKQKQIGESTLIDKIDQVVMVAAPQYGTPLAIAGLLHGDKQELGSGILLNAGVAKGLAENMPTAYGLLPSSPYFGITSTPVITFDSSVGNLKNGFDSYGPAITDKNTLDTFMKAMNVNQNLLSQSETLHSLIDAYTFPSSIKVYTIAGVGMPTVSGIKYFAKEECLLGVTGCSFALDRTLQGTLNGDGTVVAESAVANNSNQYYVDLAKLSSDFGVQYDHQNIMGAQPVRDFIGNIIKNHSTLLPVYVSTTSPVLNQFGMLTISTHSPVSLDVYNESGNHTGVSSITSSTSPFTLIDKGIPGSDYYQIGDERYVSVPADTNYSVKVTGLDTGTFSLDVQKTIGTQIVASTTFQDIPVTRGLVAALSVDPHASTTNLMLDTDGDGKADIQMLPGSSLDPVAYLQLLREVVLSLKLKTRLQDELFMKIEKLIRQIKQGKIKQVQNAVIQFSKRLSATHGWYKQLADPDRTLILNLINSFLDQFIPN